MTIVKATLEQQTLIEQVLVMGDLARLNPEQRNIYYKQVCESLGINPLTRPFEYITLNGKLQLYARKDCTDQLRKIHSVSIRIVERSVMDDLMVVTAEGTDKAGRTDSSIGAVSIAGLRGEAKANALMKAETKARRRVMLALCGLGILDESEVDSIPQARVGEPRAADKLVAAPTASPYAHAVVETVQVNPTAVTNAVEAQDSSVPSNPQNGDSGYAVLDVGEIEEHKGRGGLVWKVLSSTGDVFACTDDLIVSDLAEAKADGRPVRVEWQKRGQRKLILSVQGVSE